MLRLILYILFFLLLSRFIRRVLSAGNRETRGAQDGFRRKVETVRCAVCSTFLPAEDAIRKQSGEKMEIFCSSACYEQWRASAASNQK